MSGPTLVAGERDVTPQGGGIRCNDAYDLGLYKTKAGEYVLKVHMNLQFFFVDNGSQTWTAADKTSFVSKWKSTIKGAWDGHVVTTLKSGKKVTVEFNFTTKTGGWWAADHWEISVTKLKAGGFRRSSVDRLTGNVQLDSEDLKPVKKAGAPAGTKQVPAIHEFGHMLGLEHSYHAKSHKHHGDTGSVMNVGNKVRTRHFLPMKTWIDMKLKALGTAH